MLSNLHFVLFIRLLMGLWSLPPPLLDSHMLNVQSSCFKLTMFHNVKGAMAEHLKLNPMTKLWMRIIFSPILSENFSKYNKLACNVLSVWIYWGWKNIQQSLFHEKQALKLANNSLGTCVLRYLVRNFSHCLTSHMMIQLHYGRRW
jgi:hypothetical protein